MEVKEGILKLRCHTCRNAGHKCTGQAYSFINTHLFSKGHQTKLGDRKYAKKTGVNTKDLEIYARHLAKEHPDILTEFEPDDDTASKRICHQCQAPASGSSCRQLLSNMKQHKNACGKANRRAQNRNGKRKLPPAKPKGSSPWTIGRRNPSTSSVDTAYTEPSSTSGGTEHAETSDSDDVMAGTAGGADLRKGVQGVPLAFQMKVLVPGKWDTRHTVSIGVGRERNTQHPGLWMGLHLGGNQFQWFARNAEDPTIWELVNWRSRITIEWVKFEEDVPSRTVVPVSKNKYQTSAVHITVDQSKIQCWSEVLEHLKEWETLKKDAPVLPRVAPSSN